jgi:hypothetical protein
MFSQLSTLLALSTAIVDTLIGALTCGECGVEVVCQRVNGFRQFLSTGVRLPAAVALPDPTELREGVEGSHHVGGLGDLSDHSPVKLSHRERRDGLGDQYGRRVRIFSASWVALGPAGTTSVR